MFLGALAITTFAQDKDANTLKNEGNEFYRNNDFKGAFQSYKQALDLIANDTIDNALIYNTGYCAFKAKMYNDAEPFFIKAAEAGYKEQMPYVFLAQIYLKNKDLDKMEGVVNKGLEKYNDDKNLRKLASTCYLRKGLVYYNDGNEIKSAANNSGMNETDPEAFKAEYAKANVEFEKALPYMEKAFEFDPNSKNAVKALQNIYTNLDMADKAAALQGAVDAASGE